MEQFFENILKYSINLAVDSIYEGIEVELIRDNSISAEIALVFIEKGYKSLKAELL